MKQGTRPQTGEERQAGTKVTVALPDSMAAELSRRVKAGRRKNLAFSRNDLVRMVFLDYFRRHPFADAEPTA